MAIVYDISLPFNTVAKTVTITDLTPYLASYNIDVEALNGSITGTITGPDGVAFASGLLIDLANGDTVSSAYALPTDDDGEILNGAYVVALQLNLDATSVDIDTIVAAHTINLDGNGGLSNFFLAGDEITIPLGPNAGTYTIESATGDVSSDLIIVVSETVTNEDPTGATISFDISHTAFSGEWMYSGCDVVDPTVTVVDDCYSTQFGTIAFQDTTVLPSTHVLTSRAWSIAYPSNLSPAPTTNPVTGTASIINFTALAIGQWNYRLTENVTVTQADGLVYTYSANTGAQPFDVTCNGVLCEVSCCYQTILTKYLQDVAATNTSPLTNLVIALGALNNLAVNKRACGDKAAAEVIIQQMSDLIENSGNCDDDCGCDSETGNRWVNNAGFSSATLLEGCYRIFNGVPGDSETVSAGYPIGLVLQNYNTNIEYIHTEDDVSGAEWVIYGHEAKIMRLLLTQSSTSSPTAVILRNDFDDDPSLAYATVGVYKLTMPTGVFTANKTAIIIANNSLLAGTNSAQRTDVDEIGIVSYNASNTLANNIFLDTLLEITVNKL